jgi:hypothetical protein
VGQAARTLAAVPNFQDGSSSASLASAEDAAAQMTPAALNYLNSSPESYLDCREGRHDYPRVPISRMRFDPTPDGYDIYVVDCRSCHVAYREELWLIRENADGVVVDMRMMKRTTKYHPVEDGAPAYLMEPGSGIFRATNLREMRVASVFVGSTIRRTKPAKQAESA